MITLADNSRRGKVPPAFVCLSVSCHDISKTAAARITKRDIEMFHDESWKPIYFGVKRSKVKVMRQKTLQAWVFTLLWVLASSRFLEYNVFVLDFMHVVEVVKRRRCDDG